MTPSVVDANLINLFQSERTQAIEEVAHAALAAILANGFIVLDESQHCESEWLSCAVGTYPLALADWIADKLREEKIQLIEFTCNSMYQELNRLGIPKKDHKWVRLARSANSPLIATDDIDLIHPEMKERCDSKRLKGIKLSGKGPVAKHLRKVYGISVKCPERVPEFFE